MSFSILLSPTALLMPVSTECAAALLSFRYASYNVNMRSPVSPSLLSVSETHVL